MGDTTGMRAMAVTDCANLGWFDYGLRFGIWRLGGGGPYLALRLPNAQQGIVSMKGVPDE
jgi:hypothetical protein